MKKTLLSARNICKSFDGKSGKTKVFDKINLEIYQTDFTIIMGTSGAGKSTLLYALSGMDNITDGKIIYNGQELNRFSEKKMSALRSSDFGFVFQQHYLANNLTLFENVAVAGYLNKKQDAKHTRTRVEQLFRHMHVEKAKDRFPWEVSGGEAQRAAVARAVINKPEIIFADEPTGALNKSSTQDVLNLFTAFHEEGQSILMVTHDIRAAIRGTRIIYLEDGKILDEIILPPFKEKKEKERETRVNEWLYSLKW